jgi:hypothetical protein
MANTLPKMIIVIINMFAWCTRSCLSHPEVLLAEKNDISQRDDMDDIPTNYPCQIPVPVVVTSHFIVALGIGGCQRLLDFCSRELPSRMTFFRRHDVITDQARVFGQRKDIVVRNKLTGPTRPPRSP